MSKINQTSSQPDSDKEQLRHGHYNHMMGVSYDIKNPINQLRSVASSCFFGEPQYYHSDKAGNETLRSMINTPVKTALSSAAGKYLDSTLGSTLSFPEHRNYSAAKMVETAIDEALNYNPRATLAEAVRLRNEDNMRVTPQVIMVRAANHEKVRGTGLLKEFAQGILKRTDEASTQLAYQLQVYGNPIPNALKKAWKDFLQTRSEYDLAKYRMDSHVFKTVDVVNLAHAYSPAIDKLMKGTLALSNSETWEAMISKEGSSKEVWEKAIDVMGHMALLRNLRNLHEKGVSPDLYLDKLVETAKGGKQLPFRYFSAYNQLKNAGVSGRVLDAVEKCLELSLGDLPRFEGRVMGLSDNSGSAQSTQTSSMGSMRVADIGNLTAIITGKISDDGYIGVFGDSLKIQPVRKGSSVFDQVNAANSEGHNIGQSTENGIWMFFDKAISEKQHWDHIFIYSDMQAGHGGLYGLDVNTYKDYVWKHGTNNRYIDVAKLVKTYREKVNPDVHVYMVQIAGQKDTLVPEFYDKTYILGGWGDGVLRFAHRMSHPQEVQSYDNSVKDNSSKNKTEVFIKKSHRFQLSL